MTEKICTFFGHRNTPDTVSLELSKTIRDLITDRKVNYFYVGHNGNFDRLCREALNIYKKAANIQDLFDYKIVLSSPKNINLFGGTIFRDNCILPPELVNSDPRYAIYTRNMWMLSRSEYVICYAGNDGNSARWLERAYKKNKKVINLYKTKDERKEAAKKQLEAMRKANEEAYERFQQDNRRRTLIIEDLENHLTDYSDEYFDALMKEYFEGCPKE